MKTLIKLLLIISILILVASSIKLFDISVSYKYEVEEPIAMHKFSNTIQKSEGHLGQFVFWLELLVFYSLVVSVFTGVMLFKLKSDK